MSEKDKNIWVGMIIGGTAAVIGFTVGRILRNHKK